jgi:hypothetical protein
MDFMWRHKVNKPRPLAQLASLLLLAAGSRASQTGRGLLTLWRHMKLIYYNYTDYDNVVKLAYVFRVRHFMIIYEFLFPTGLGDYLALVISITESLHLLLTNFLNLESNNHRKGPKVFGLTQIHSCVNSRHRRSTALYKFARIMFGCTLRKRHIQFFCRHR